MATTAIIIQARMGSTRCPGKVLEDIAGETVISHVVRRAKAVSGVDVVCLATSELPADDPIAREGARCGAVVFRGSESDVLARYLGAAEMIEADVIMRLTCDCPLLDPDVCAAVLQLLANSGADYASNTLELEWPHGLDCEAFPIGVLQNAAAEARAPDEREHVTVWMKNHPDLIRVNLSGPGGDAVQQRWTLDFPEDLAFLQALYEHLPDGTMIPTWRDILDAVRRHPELASINRSRILPERLA